MGPQQHRLVRQFPSPLRPVAQKAVDAGRWVRDSLADRRYRAQFDDVETYCLFVGPRRSGTTLLGQLLNAHPNIAISHQLYSLLYVDGWRRSLHFQRILDKDREFVHDLNCTWHGYEYRVPGQWQGRFTSLRVIGDKGAARATKMIQQDPDILKRLERLTGVPTKFVMVVRNPFDVIGNYRKHELFPTTEEAVDDYFAACATCVDTMAVTRPEQWFILRLESFVQDPARVVRELCDFLGVDYTEEYVEACRGRVFPSARNTRNAVPWDSATIRVVEERVRSYDFLAGYTFEADAAAGRS